MRLVFLGHACHLVELDGVRILTDPWLVDPIFGGHVERDPPLAFGPADLPPLDAVALSHGHLDHFNAPTLAALPDKSIPVVHPVVTSTELDANLRRLGFHALHARDDWEPFEVGGVRITPTPSLGVMDECAFHFAGRGGAFWNGVDAPQPPEVVREVADRLGKVDVGAFSHNSFDQPSLLGIDSLKEADHGPQGAVRSARILGARAAIPAASNMRWRGPRGEAVTRKVVRRSHTDFGRALAAGAPEVTFLDLAPGDAWSPEGGIERAALRGTPAPRVANDYLHAFLETGERLCPDARPATADTLRRDLPARLRARPEAARGVAQQVQLRVVGDDPGEALIDFSSLRVDVSPGAGDGAAYALQMESDDWKDLFERRLSWQVLLVSDRLRVLRFEPGAPPCGLHFAYALQGIFP